MSASAYTLELLRLASESGGFPRIPSAEYHAERRAPVCGSRIAIDLEFEGGTKVRAVGMTVNACAFGQAAAVVFARNAPGKKPAEIAAARDALARFLAGEAPGPGNWPGIETLAGAQSLTARHGAILLAFDAAMAALGQAEA